MSEEPQAKSCCLYGQPIFAVCSDPKCQHPAVICENGYYNNDECGQFHDNCSKVVWSKVQGFIDHNPNVCCPDFHQIKDKIDALFIEIIKKVKN